MAVLGAGKEHPPGLGSRRLDNLSKGVVPAKLREALRDALAMKVVRKTYFNVYNSEIYLLDRY